MALREEPSQRLRQAPVTLIGNSQEAKRMREFAQKAAAVSHTVLLTGETGSGKDHLAELIHSKGRPDKPFVPVDCGALTESLSETELFGHTQGAFTDARETKPGLVQVAKEGTLFFNEVANMSLGLQVKFLRILEKRSFRPVGGTREIEVDTRIIAATNADLELAVRRGALRSDLYQRLNGISFMIKPLRERVEDIPELAEHFLYEESPSKKFTAEALALMMGYHWPGNVRELRNAVVRAAFLTNPKEDIRVDHLHPHLTGVGGRELPTLRELQRNYLREVLKKCKGSVARAAIIAGISTGAMRRKIEKFHLQDFADSLDSEAPV